MAKFQSLLNLRLTQKSKAKQKMKDLAIKAKNGELSSFAGVFRLAKLSDMEKDNLSEILKNFQEHEDYDNKKDLEELLLITSEIKSITNQALLLHGERIKKAQNILKNYKEGAFSSWLISTYGNRQTPYNFLQYFELHSSVSKDLKQKINLMPRQAVYSLASRAGEIDKKEEVIANYKGETKQEILSIIRKRFPLDRDDKRLPNIANQSISSLIRLKDLFSHSLFDPTEKQKTKLYELIDEIFVLMKK